VTIQDVNTITWGTLEEAESRELFPGIVAKTIWAGNDNSKAIVVDFAPGSKWDGIDLHEPGAEEVFVITGVLNDGIRDFEAGTFIHNPKGSFHVPRSEKGCRLFLFFPKG